MISMHFTERIKTSIGVTATANGPDTSTVTTSSGTKSPTGSLQMLLRGKRSTSQYSNGWLGSTLC